MDYRVGLLLFLFITVIVIQCSMVRSFGESDDCDHMHNPTNLETDCFSCNNVSFAPAKSHEKEREANKKPLCYYNGRRSGKKYKYTELTRQQAWEMWPEDIREMLNTKESPLKALFSRLFIIACVTSYCSIWLVPFPYLSRVGLTLLRKLSTFQVPCSPMKNNECYKGKRFDINDYLHGALDKMKDWKTSFLSEMGDVWSNNNFVVYSLTSMERVASFSGFRNPSQIPMMKLSKFGFYYTKKGELLKCTDCTAVVQASNIVSPPSDKKYHASPNCQFAQTGDDAIGTACMIDTHSSPNNNEGGEQSSGAETSGASNIHSPEDQHGGDIARHDERDKLETDTTAQEAFGWYDDIDFTHQSTCPKEQHNDEASPSNIIRPSDLTAEDLPPEIRYDPIVSLLKKVATLTVGIRVNCPQKTNHKECCGTGSAFLDCTDHSQIWLKTLEDNNQLKGEQLKIWKSHSKIYYFAVVTSKHVVFNQEQAIRAEVKLTFDQDSEECVNVHTIAVKESSVEGDYTSYLICYTLEKDLFRKLLTARQELTEQANTLSPKMKEMMTRYSLIVSYPPVESKMISFGKSMIAKYVLKTYVDKKKMEYCSNKESLFATSNSDIREVLLYNASTHPGSSGSPVFTFRKTKEDGKFKMAMWIHTGIEKTTKLGGSIMKSVNPDCLPDEDPMEIKMLEDKLRRIELPVNPTPEMAASKTAKKGVPPLYPEYFYWKERLASFVNFKSKCHHSNEELALGGFFFTGNGDCVRCFYCGLGLKAWRKDDDMYVEHERSRSSCGFLKVCLKSQEELKLDLLKRGPRVSPPKDGKMTPAFTISLLTEEKRILQQQRLCKMCFRHEVRELFLPCGEIQTCEECAGILSTCPACNTKIDATVSVFMS